MSILKLRSEVTQLEQLYAASLYAANLAASQLGIAEPEGAIDLSKPVDVLKDEPGYITPTGFQLRRYARHRYQAQLREVLLVRLVSALEVFLIETLVSLFMARKDLFAKKDEGRKPSNTKGSGLFLVHGNPIQAVIIPNVKL